MTSAEGATREEFPANLSGKRTEKTDERDIRPCARFHAACAASPERLTDLSRSAFHFLGGKTMGELLENLEAVLYPIVCSINTYLSSYILVVLLIGVGLW